MGAEAAGREPGEAGGRACEGVAGSWGSSDGEGQSEEAKCGVQGAGVKLIISHIPVG